MAEGIGTKELYTIDKENRLHLSLHAGQARAWQSKKRFVFVFGGSQGGKTSFCPWWLWREIRTNGPGDYLCVSGSFDLFKLKLLPELRTVFEDVLHCGRYWRGDQVMELTQGCQSGGKFLAKRASDKMWGRIIMRSAESKKGLESATCLAAVMDECGLDEFTIEEWEAVQRRLSLSQGRVLGIS